MSFIPTYGTGFEMGSMPFLPNEYQYVGISTTSPHHGSYCIANTHGYNGWVNLPGPETAGEFSMGIWSKDGIEANQIWIYMEDSTYFSLRTSGAYFDLYINETKVADGTLPVQSNVWTNIQIDALIGSNGYIRVKISGALDIDYNGNTQPGSSNVPVTVKLKSFGWINAFGYWDDIVIGHGGFPGDYKFDAIVAVSDSTPRQWYRNGISCQTPPDAPSVAVGASGNLTGDYRYRVTFIDNLGETWGGTITELVQPATQKIELSAIPSGLVPDTTARKIYRTANGGSVYKLVDTINDNITTTYSDNKIDGDLGTTEPSQTINYTTIDEIGPNDSDYIYSPNNGDRDMFNMGDWDATQKIPKIVMLWGRASKDTANGQELKLLHKAGGTTLVGPTHDLTTSPSYIWDAFVEQPCTGPWTDDAIDDLEVGVEAVIVD